VNACLNCIVLGRKTRALAIHHSDDDDDDDDDDNERMAFVQDFPSVLLVRRLQLQLADACMQVSHQGKRIEDGFCSGAAVYCPSAFTCKFDDLGVFYYARCVLTNCWFAL